MAGITVFGLDIGTRSIVGTVGYREKDRFVVKAQRVREHETRAMLDGQIHDIKKVGETIRAVKEELEQDIGATLSEVCIAAAGRVLRTVTTHVEHTYAEEKTILEEDVYALSAMGVEQAYEEFISGNDTDMKFYCVGYTVIRYYMNHYPIGNPEAHKASSIGADMIVTFLPEDVVDGLYKAVECAGLKVANLTLEPIAAISVAIPEKFRMLNIALVDVGAGTSDISITKDGAIVSYGMIPVAGDSLTEMIAQHCLVDFNTAEQIKRQLTAAVENKDIVVKTVTYEDIMGLPQTMPVEELIAVIKPTIEDMTDRVAACIKELNGDKTVSAVFVVGGGGKIPGYTESLSGKLDIVKERVAIRGKEVMGFVDFPEHIEKDSLLVTPIGICLTFYDQNNSFVYVTFNEERIKIYDNGKLSVVDAAMQSGFPNDGLFPKRGRELNYTVEGKARIKRGESGEAAIITVNGEPADIHTPIKANDIVSVMPSTAGSAARLEVRNLPEFNQSISVNVNDKKVSLPKFVLVNGALQSGYYEIQDGDSIEMQNFYTVSQILEFMDVILPENVGLVVNNMPADKDTPVYENFTVAWGEEYVEVQSFHEMVEEYEAAEEVVPQAAEVAGVQNMPGQAVATQSGGVQGMSGSSQVTGAPAQGMFGQAVGVQGMSGQMAATDMSGNSHVAAGTTVQQAPVQNVSGQQTDALTQNMPGQAVGIQSVTVQAAPTAHDIVVLVNGTPIRLSGKTSYVYVDIFDYIEFDLKNPKGGGIVTMWNGQPAEYLKEIKDGDVIEVYWKN